MLALRKPELETRLEQTAADQKTTAEDLLHRAVSEYLEKAAAQKIQAESLVFEELHPQLISEYLGDYVAIHNGDVIDRDADVRTLHLRIRKQFGQIPVLLRQVTHKIEQQDLIFRSPKLESIT